MFNVQVYFYNLPIRISSKSKNILCHSYSIESEIKMRDTMPIIPLTIINMLLFLFYFFVVGGFGNYDFYQIKPLSICSYVVNLFVCVCTVYVVRIRRICVCVRRMCCCLFYVCSTYMETTDAN